MAQIKGFMWVIEKVFEVVNVIFAIIIVTIAGLILAIVVNNAFWGQILFVVILATAMLAGGLAIIGIAGLFIAFFYLLFTASEEEEKAYEVTPLPFE